MALISRGGRAPALFRLSPGVCSAPCHDGHTAQPRRLVRPDCTIQTPPLGPIPVSYLFRLLSFHRRFYVGRKAGGHQLARPAGRRFCPVETPVMWHGTTASCRPPDYVIPPLPPAGVVRRAAGVGWAFGRGGAHAAGTVGCVPARTAGTQPANADPEETHRVCGYSEA